MTRFAPINLGPINPGNRVPRDSLLLMGTIRIAGDAARTSDPIRVRNLSASGLMAVGEAAYAVGSRVEVEIRGTGPVSGEIVWVRQNRMGITFDSAIDPKLARQPVVAGTDDHLRKIWEERVRLGLRID